MHVGGQVCQWGQSMLLQLLHVPSPQVTEAKRCMQPVLPNSSSASIVAASAGGSVWLGGQQQVLGGMPCTLNRILDCNCGL